MPVKRLLGLLLVPIVLLLGGCHTVLLDPEGYVALQQSDIMVTTTIIIAIIIVPVLIAIAVVAWRYRASNKNAEYDAEWDHSPQLELLVWAGPLLIIIAVGAISWIGTHQTDPYQPLHHIAAGKPIPADAKPLQVEVVSLRWKWLFFYPQYGIATVNELAAPVNRPIQFHLTGDVMMDSFFVPTLAGQVYTMPGMETELHGVINQVGVYKGFSANYSGHGFTDMRFNFYGMSKGDFNQWVAKVRASDKTLDIATYQQLRQPTRDAPVHYYGDFATHLYDRILNRCVDTGKTCMVQWMADGMHGDHGMPMHDAPTHDMPMRNHEAGSLAPADDAEAATTPAAATH